jgi:hypothetical protein
MYKSSPDILTRESVQRGAPSADRLLGRLSIGAALGLIGLLALQLLDLGIIWRHEWSGTLDRDFAERWLAYLAQQAYPGGQGQTAVVDLPFNASPYPPLSMLLNGGLGRLWSSVSGGSALGSNALDNVDLLTIRSVGRSVSLGATLGSAGLVGLIASRLGATRPWAALAIALFLTATRAQMFAVSLRPDALAAMLTLMGVAVLVDRPRNPMGRLGRGLGLDVASGITDLDQFSLFSIGRLVQGRAIGAGLLLGLALTAKHCFIAVPLVWLALGFQSTWRGRRESHRELTGLLLGLGVAVLGIGSIAQICLGSHWPQVFQLQGLHRINGGQAIVFIGQAFSQPVLPLGVASLFGLELTGRRRPIALVFVVSLLLNGLALLKIGAAGNYFLEPVAFASILAALALQQHWPQGARHQTGLLLLLLTLQLPTAISQSRLAIQVRHQADTGQGSATIVARLKAIEAPILTEFAGFYYDSGHLPYVMPGDLIGAAIEGGKIDGQPLESMIERHDFGAIVLRKDWQKQPFYPKRWMDAIQAHYVGQPIDDWLFMTPKSVAQTGVSLGPLPNSSQASRTNSATIPAPPK